MKKILFVNQAINHNTIELFNRLSYYYGKGIVLTGTQIEGNKSHLEYVITSAHNAKNYFTRILSWISFIYHIRRWLIVNLKNIDYVLVYSNPPIAPLYIGYLCRKRRIRYSVMVWDIYPNLIEKMSLSLFFKPILSLWHIFNKKIYDCAQSVITLGDEMACIVNDDMSDNTAHIIENWSSPGYMKPVKKSDNVFIEKHNLSNKFIVLYSGKMGLGHEIKTILKASEDCRDNDVVFLFIGSGPGADIVRKHMTLSKKSNVRYLPLQDSEMFKYSMASGDVGIVSQLKGLEKYFMPSKTYDMMAAGLPLIGISSGQNDLRKTISKYECGYNVNSGDSKNLLECIVKLKSDLGIRILMSNNSRKAVDTFFNIDIVFKRYTEILKI